MRDFDELIERAKKLSKKKRLAVVAAHDNHTLEALSQAYEDGIIEPILIGDKNVIESIIDELELSLKDVKIINEEDSKTCVQIAADLINSKEADFIMKGKVSTRDLMKILVNKDKGIRKNDTMSLLAFMDSPNYHKVFSITDVGLLTYPDRQQKIGALNNAIEAFHRLGVSQPKVAVITAVETVNEKMPETVDADVIKQMGLEGAIIEGPISFDLAMDIESAKIKGFESVVSGDADILLVPDIVSGNLAAKSLTVLGNARTGGVVLGAKVPVLLVSRAASSDDKYMSIVISALISE